MLLAIKNYSMFWKIIENNQNITIIILIIVYKRIWIL